MRLVWLAVGCACVALGAAGVLLSLLPTTPFLLLAAFAFAKSSDRFHAWLIGHPVLGPPIVAWRERRAISRKAKMLAMISLACAIAASVALGVPTPLLLLQMAIVTPVAGFILTRRET